MEGARYLEDGKLTIFKRSGVFYARIRVRISPVKYTWRSLKTSNEQTAVDLNRGLIRVFRRNQNYSPLSSTITSATVNGVTATVRLRQEC